MLFLDKWRTRTGDTQLWAVVKVMGRESAEILGIKAD